MNLRSETSVFSVLETAMGIKIDDSEDSRMYKENLYKVAELWTSRFSKPILHPDFIWRLSGYNKIEENLLRPVKSFTRNIIKQRRKEFLKFKARNELNGENV